MTLLAQIESDGLDPAAIALLVVAFIALAVAARYGFCRLRTRLIHERAVRMERIAERERFWELAPDMMCVADFDGIVRRVNPAVERTMGYTAEQLVGAPFIELVHPDDMESVRADLAEAIAGRSVFESVNRFRDANGEYRSLTWNTQPEVQSGLFFAVGHDVSSRVIAEEQQKAQEEILEEVSRLQQAILDSSDYTIVTTDPYGIITTYNRAAERMFGYTADEIIGKQTPSIFHLPEELGRAANIAAERAGHPVDANIQVFRTLAQPGKPFEAEWTMRRKDGTTLPTLLSVTVLQDGVGRVTGLLGVARDITQRKAHEAELHRLLGRFQALAALAPVGIFLTNAKGKCVYFNEMYETLSGRPGAESMGDQWVKAIHPEDRPRLAAVWAGAVAAGTGTEQEFRFQHHNGRTIDARVVTAPLLDPDDNIEGYIGTTWDISAEKRYVESLEHDVNLRTAELTETNKQLNREVAERHEIERRAGQLRDQLTHVARLSTMGELAAGLAHELNQPLGAIANYSQGLARMIEAGTADDSDLTGTLGKVADQAHRAGQIIQRLRNLVAKREIERKPTDVDRLIHEVVELLEHTARHGSVAIELDLPDDLPTVATDRIQIQQVVLNLMRNGIESMVAADSPTKRLTVRASCDDDNHGPATIEVTDTGPGCSDTQMSHLFDAFYTTKSSGMGMGLSISQTIVRTHGGRIWADRNEGGGMTFRFTLPIQEADTHGQSTQITQIERR